MSLPTQKGGGTAPATSVNVANAASVHEMFISLAILSAFVYVSALIAGSSRTAGRAVLLLFVILVVMQGVGHVNPLAAWLLKHPLTPAPTPTAKG